MDISPSSESAEKAIVEAPDATIPFEALRWRSDIFGGVMIDTSAINKRFIQSRLETLHDGVKGRGKVDLSDEGVLIIQFGLSNDEIKSGFLNQYIDELLAYLHLAPDAVIDTRIAEIQRDPESRDEVTADLRRLGLRALQDFD